MEREADMREMLGWAIAAAIIMSMSERADHEDRRRAWHEADMAEALFTSGRQAAGRTFEAWVHYKSMAN